jgi:voltage-gated potassium channel
VPPGDARPEAGAEHPPVAVPATPDGWPGRSVVAQEITSFLWRSSLVLVLLTACYYLLPAGSPWSGAVPGARWATSLLSLFGAAVIMRYQLRSARSTRSIRARAEAVLTALYLLILFFAVVYDRLARAAPDQFAGIHNQTDALYFTVTITATVGFGDISAVGTAARAIVTLHMLVNLVYVGLALRVLTTFSKPSGGTAGPAASPATAPEH